MALSDDSSHDDNGFMRCDLCYSGLVEYEWAAGGSMRTCFDCSLDCGIENFVPIHDQLGLTSYITRYTSRDDKKNDNTGKHVGKMWVFSAYPETGQAVLTSAYQQSQKKNQN